MRLPFLTLFVLCVIAGCSVRSRLVENPAPAEEHELVVTADHWVNGLTIEPGTVFRVPLPADHREWAVSFSDQVLRLMTSAERVSRPAVDGWRFAARRKGATDVVFEGVASGAQLPNVPRFTLQVTVR